MKTNRLLARKLATVNALRLLADVQSLRSARAEVLAIAYADLKSRGADPGSLISGIESYAFAEVLQDWLRQNAGAITKTRDLAMAEWTIGAGRRIDTFRRELNKRPAPAFRGYYSRY